MICFLQSFRYVSWYQSRLNPDQMANARDESEILGGGEREDNLVTGAEFRNFQHETQQTLQEFQAALARLTTGNHQRGNDPPVRHPYRNRTDVQIERYPGMPRRQPIYDDTLSEDEMKLKPCFKVIAGETKESQTDKRFA